MVNMKILLAALYTILTELNGEMFDYQNNFPMTIISIIFMTYAMMYVTIWQKEIWFWSLLRLEELRCKLLLSPLVERIQETTRILDTQLKSVINITNCSVMRHFKHFDYKLLFFSMTYPSCMLNPLTLYLAKMVLIIHCPYIWCKTFIQ